MFSNYLLVCVVVVIVVMNVCRIRQNHPGELNTTPCLGTDIVHDEKQEVAVVLHADTYLKLWYKMISNAERSVYFSVYTWKIEHDNIPPHLLIMGAAFKSIIGKRESLNNSARQDPPVMVYIMYNSQNVSSTQTNSLYLTLKYWSEMGIDIQPSNPHLRLFFLPWKHTFFNNNHVKFLTVDGRETVLFSGNIERASHGGPGAWRECGLYVRGHPFAAMCEGYYRHMASLAKASHTTSAEMWQKLNTPRRRGRLVITGTVKWLDRHGSSGSPGSLVNDAIPAEDLQLISCPEVITVFKNPHANLFSTYRHARNIRSYVHLIEASKSAIWIMTPTINDMVIVNALLDAGKRGVQVHVVTGHAYNNQPVAINILRCAGHLSNQQVGRYLSAGSNIAIRWYKRGLTDGCRLCDAQCECNMSVHAKMAVFDQETLFIGSSNLDVFSTIYSAELDVIIKDKTLACVAMRDCITPLWNQASGVKKPHNNG